MWTCDRDANILYQLLCTKMLFDLEVAAFLKQVTTSRFYISLRNLGFPIKRTCKPLKSLANRSIEIGCSRWQSSLQVEPLNVAQNGLCQEVSNHVDVVHYVDNTKKSIVNYLLNEPRGQCKNLTQL